MFDASGLNRGSFRKSATKSNTVSAGRPIVTCHDALITT
jgi:hypothetical protein